jgi:hypothetical protein
VRQDTAHSPEDGKATLGSEPIERGLHGVGNFSVALVDDVVVLRGIRPVCRPADRFAELDGHLRRERPGRYPSRNEAEWWSEHKWHDLDAEQSVEAQTCCHPLSPSEDDERFMGAHGDGRNDRGLRAESEADEAESFAEFDAVPFPPWPEDLEVATRVVEKDPPAAKDGLRVGLAGLDRAGALQQEADAWYLEQEMVEQRIDRLEIASFAPPRGQEDRNVRRHLTSRVVPDHEKGAFRRQVLEAPHL